MLVLLSRFAVFPTILLCLLAFPFIVQAQDPMIPPALYAVQRAPFDATIESVWDGNANVMRGRSLSRIVRDSAGRERYEIPTIEEASVTGQQPSVLIYDVVKERIIRLNAVQKEAVIQPMTRVGRTIMIDPSARRGYPCTAPRDYVSLGTRTVAGWEVCGMRSASGELWLSTNYLMPLMAIRSSSPKGKLTQKLIQMDTHEPDERLFEIPAGYTVHPQ